MQSGSSVTRVFLIGGTFIFCVAVVVIALQFTGYIINDILQVEGWLRTALQFLAVIVTLYPMKALFWTVVNRQSKSS